MRAGLEGGVERVLERLTLVVEILRADRVARGRIRDRERRERAAGRDFVFYEDALAALLLHEVSRRYRHRLCETNAHSAKLRIREHGATGPCPFRGCLELAVRAPHRGSVGLGRVCVAGSFDGDGSERRAPHERVTDGPLPGTSGAASAPGALWIGDAASPGCPRRFVDAPTRRIRLRRTPLPRPVRGEGGRLARWIRYRGGALSARLAARHRGVAVPGIRLRRPFLT